MNVILFDGPVRTALLPFTFTRPVAEIRIGILTLREKWEHYLKSSTSTLTQTYLQEKYPLIQGVGNILIDPSFLPTSDLVDKICNLKAGEGLFIGDSTIAFHSGGNASMPKMEKIRPIQYPEAVLQVKNTWDIFSKNGVALEADFDLITKGRKSAAIPKTNRLIRPERIFAEEGAIINYSILNATEGPIYVGKNAEIWEGSLIRGSFALCNNAVVKMGGKVYGPTTVGPHGKISGEISNSVIFGYSSKGHEGYLGNSVLGEWCNIGADSNNSNLKNNYAKVRLWNYATERFEQTGLQFCGLMMGDHSKTAINTMFNTGTVIGVNSNIYVPGFPRNFIPSFSWGGASGFSTYSTQKAFETAQVMMARRGVLFSDEDARILEEVFEQTKKYRNYVR